MELLNRWFGGSREYKVEIRVDNVSSPCVRVLTISMGIVSTLLLLCWHLGKTIRTLLAEAKLSMKRLRVGFIG